MSRNSSNFRYSDTVGQKDDFLVYIGRKQQTPRPGSDILTSFALGSVNAFQPSCILYLIVKKVRINIVMAMYVPSPIITTETI
jgi:hypothetical protein